jgi:hypothetical protein
MEQRGLFAMAPAQARELRKDAETHGVYGERREESGTLSVEP